LKAVIAALGAGRMGRGIAHAFAYAGHEVLLVDLKERSAVASARIASESIAEVRQTLSRLAELGAFDACLVDRIAARVHFVARHDAHSRLPRADIAFEAVPEVMDAKRDALAFACPLLREGAVVASTTSSFLVTDLCAMASRPQNFLNAHWLNPAYLIPLVELSPHPGTAPQALTRAKELLKSIGKIPVVCKPAPGYIVPRLQALVMSEAARMVEEGVATPEDIDRAVRYGFGFRYANMGVVEFIDYGGVDILWYAGNYMAGKLGERFQPPPIVERLMREGKKGLREGEGFYDWKNIDRSAWQREALGRQVAMLRHLGLLRPPALAREN
jgi:3-hydroxybutyryl-CoA dehydrogenase